MFKSISMAIFLFLIVATGCLCTKQKPALRPAVENNTQAMREDNIKEAVFRYLFKHNASGQQDSVAAYFLVLDKDTDPTDEFMQRFVGHKPMVKKFSQCTASKHIGVVDNETKANGLLFRVMAVKNLADNRVEVQGEYYEGGLSAAGYTFIVVYKFNNWVIEDARMDWIS